MASTPRTARERARAEITQEILETARRHLARDGAAALSLRAVARDCGMVSSAIYRYFPSRDALLTRLIIDAYDSLGAAVEESARASARRGLVPRFVAAGVAVRDWAVANPHEYALLYGSPVPGYAAPQDTIGPASRVPAVLITILRDVRTAREAAPSGERRPVSRALSAAISPIRAFEGTGVPDDLLLHGMAAWSSMFGAVSFEVFGHLTNVVDDDPAIRRGYFELLMADIAQGLGLDGR
ncbi:MAG: TetR/AcrR family transcriptional regulator [Candidatus Nanopelagicales bacterium]|jgi:AcrR family transcriptional regulator